LGNRILFKLCIIAWSAAFFACTPESSNTDGHRGFDEERLEKLNSLDAYNYDKEFGQETSSSLFLTSSHSYSTASPGFSTLFSATSSSHS
jgi:hypothetical protein